VTRPVVVTGAAGYLGNVLCRELLGSGYAVRALVHSAHDRRSLDGLRAEGLGILLVEQDANLALKHADRGYVMRTGHVVLSGTAQELANNDDVRLIYLGAWHGKE